MTKPKLIIFDYGHTLIYEDYFNLEQGGAAFYEHISDKRGIDRESFIRHSVDLYNELSASRRELSLELPCDCFTRYLREYYDIEFDTDETSLQRAYWDAISPPHPMPGADEMLAELSRMCIRTAVLSNLWYNEDVLSGRILRLLPHADFEFCISTHAYGFRKPRGRIFELALKKAGVSAFEAWFCGDEPRADIHGAHDAGLTPVWFESELVCPYKFTQQADPSVPCIHIRSLNELTEILKNG